MTELDRRKIKQYIASYLERKIKVFKDEITDVWVETADLRESLDAQTKNIQIMTEYIKNNMPRND